MDIFQKRIKILKENEQIFNQYCGREELGILISDDKKHDFLKKGGELLEEEEKSYFEEVRSIYYHNVVNKTLCEFSFPEWVVCIEEKVLLEYAVPIFSRVLKVYPMLYVDVGICDGEICQWKILYEVSKIDEFFWNKHIEWKNFFKNIIKDILDKNEKKEITFIDDKYIIQFYDFLKK